jgi:hypothetical protein
MARKITDHSYQYIQGWLKNEYKTNPEFREKMLANNRLQNERIKSRRLISITLLENETKSYQSFYHI